MNSSKNIYIKTREHLGKGNKFWIYHIDFIKKILEINVFTFVTISLNKITFYILSQTNPNNILFKCIFTLNSFSENSINMFVKLIKKIISELEFDKLIGVFISKITKNNKPLFFDEFGTNYIDKKSCMGCSELTSIQLKCGHFLCYTCFENISNNKECICCKKISYPSNQFKYWEYDDLDELRIIKKWIGLNRFFPNTNLNIKHLLNLNNNDDDDENDWDDDDDENDWVDDNVDEYADEYTDEDNWVDEDDANE